MGKQYVTKEMLHKLHEANEATRGTYEWRKYHMCWECKYYRNGRWTNWKFIMWTIPSDSEYYFKKKGDRLYIMGEIPQAETIATHTIGECIEREIERYEVTDAVRELWGISEAKEEIKLPRYGFEIWCGRTYCGNGERDTIDECINFAIDDGFCDKVKIHDNETNMDFIIKIEGR
jgi:hypothetical protein